MDEDFNSRKEDIKKLIVAYSRRLQKLKEQVARGDDDPNILIQIEDIEAQIKQLKEELKELEEKKDIVFTPNNRGRDIIINDTSGHAEILSNLKVNTKREVFKEDWFASFILSKSHTIRFLREGTLGPTVHLYVDGQKIFKRKISVGEIYNNYSEYFQIENIDCEFNLTITMAGTLLFMKVLIGGYQVLPPNNDVGCL